MSLELRSSKVGPIVVIDAAGKLTLSEGRTMLRDHIHVSTGYGAKKFVIDLSKVDAIDSYGVGELVRSFSVIRQSGGELKLAAVSKRVLEVLQMSRLHNLFETYPDQTAALLAFGQPA